MHVLANISCTRCCDGNATRASIANPPNSAQLGGIRYHSPKLHPGPFNNVGMRPRTDRQTDARDHNTFRFVFYTIHAKCNNKSQRYRYHDEHAAHRRQVEARISQRPGRPGEHGKHGEEPPTNELASWNSAGMTRQHQLTFTPVLTFVRFLRF